VERLCTSVGAPAPSEIHLMCEVNASASFRRGMTSMAGNDLVLTIGLPLVAGQDLRQFTGVLAHEFGHFAQGAGMRANYLIRTVSHWFARVVHQRDAWDDRLVAWSDAAGNLHIAAAVPLWLARLMVWVTRRILWVLMLIGHLCSSWLSRQMEFDADRHAARVVGAGAFGSALRDLPVIGMAEAGAHADLRSAWQEGRLADDLPALIRANIGQIPADRRARAVEDGLDANASMYASHPATRDRLRNGLVERSAPVFRADGPATALFRDFPGLCRSATLAWYRDVAELPVDGSALVPTAEIVAGYEARQRAGAVWERLADGLPAEALILAPADGGEPLSAAQPVAGAKERSQAALAALVSRGRLGAALDLYDAKVRIDPVSFGLARADRQTIDAAVDAAGQDLGKAWQDCAPAVARARVRIAAIPGDEADALRATIAAIALQGSALRELITAHTALEVVLGNLDALRGNEAAMANLLRTLAAQRRRIASMAKGLRETRYPFSHAKGEVTLGAFAFPRVPTRDEDAGGIMEAAGQGFPALLALVQRCAYRLAELAEPPAPAA
jgi:hypothetical protein